MNRDFTRERKRMVELMKKRGISDQRVLSAMGALPRERFLGSTNQFMAYNDFPLPIGKGQTISQPYIVAKMTELLGLRGDEKVLEVGTGSAYQAGVLGVLSRKVISVESEKFFVDSAQDNLFKAGVGNVKVVEGDGSQGYLYAAPFDAIMVTAAAESVPKPLLEQLAMGGRLVMPVGGRARQVLVKVEKKKIDGKLTMKVTKHDDCQFVPLKGKFAW